MRFLMLNWRDPFNPRAGGAERVSQGYLAHLVSRGHEVFWFSPLFKDAGPRDVIEGIQIVRGGAIGSSIVTARKWYQQQKRFDLVIDQHHGIPWYAPWWCRTHCVAYIHEVLGPIWNVFYRWPYSVIGRHQERWTHWWYRNVPFWTASAATKQGLESAGVRNVTLIPYGVHTVALPELDPKPLAQPLRLVMVSRLEANKRIEHGLQALKLLLSDGIRATLTIVGTGEYVYFLRETAQKLQLTGNVTFTGALPEKEKDRALHQAHLLLHTSVREGWGLNVIEANAMGTPAVVYPVAGLVESTLHNETGLVSATETPLSLAAAISGLLKEPQRYQQFRRNAWERSKKYHWSVVLPQASAWLEAQAHANPDRP